MKKLLSLVILIMLLLVGCNTTNKYENIKIEINKYLDASSGVEVVSYNNYKLIKFDTISNEDGSITVTLQFNKPIK